MFIWECELYNLFLLCKLLVPTGKKLPAITNEGHIIIKEVKVNIPLFNLTEKWIITPNLAVNVFDAKLSFATSKTLSYVEIVNVYCK